MMRLPDVVVAVHGAFAREDIPHAIGGAIALGYHAQPRGTVEVDVDVFLPPAQAAPVVAVLETLGASVPDPLEVQKHLPVAGLRCTWAGVPVDLFFAFDAAFFAVVADRTLQLPFADSTGTIHDLPFISAEDLTIFKIRFDRPKDWVDIEAMVDAGPLDVEYVQRWVLHLGGEGEWPRLQRLLALAGRRPC